MDYVTTFLSQQPLLTLFLTVALGYLVGEVDIKGFSFGSGAVLFVGLFVGWLAPAAAPPPLVGTLGLALFLYSIGIQYGKEFFTGLIRPYGQKANLLCLFSLALAGALSLLFIDLFGLNPGYALGLFAGAGTSTPALQGRPCFGGQQRSRDRLFGNLSYRRRRSDPAHVSGLHHHQTSFGTPGRCRPGMAGDYGPQQGVLRQTAWQRCC